MKKYAERIKKSSATPGVTTSRTEANVGITSPLTSQIISNLSADTKEETEDYAWKHRGRLAYWLRQNEGTSSTLSNNCTRIAVLH